MKQNSILSKIASYLLLGVYTLALCASPKLAYADDSWDKDAIGGFFDALNPFKQDSAKNWGMGSTRFLCLNHTDKDGNSKDPTSTSESPLKDATDRTQAGLAQIAATKAKNTSDQYHNCSSNSMWVSIGSGAIAVDLLAAGFWPDPGGFVAKVAVTAFGAVCAAVNGALTKTCIDAISAPAAAGILWGDVILGGVLATVSVAAGLSSAKQNDIANKFGDTASKDQAIADGFKGDANLSKTNLSLNTSGASVSVEGLASHPAIKTALDKAADATGYSSTDLFNALKNGASIPDLLANAPKAAGSGKTADEIRAMVQNNMDQGKMAMLQQAPNKDTMVASVDEEGGGGAASRSPASKGANSFDFDFTNGAGANAGSAQGAGGAKLSDAAKAALNKRALDELSIFEIVHKQYEKKTAIMFGAGVHGMPK